LESQIISKFDRVYVKLYVKFMKRIRNVIIKYVYRSLDLWLLLQRPLQVRVSATDISRNLWAKAALFSSNRQVILKIVQLYFTEAM
jgi:hypothetical protein